MTEFLPGLLSQPGIAGLTGSVHLHATDGTSQWWVSLDDKDRAVALAGHRKADTAIRATRSDLLLWLTNRQPPDRPGDRRPAGSRHAVDSAAPLTSPRSLVPAARGGNEPGRGRPIQPGPHRSGWLGSAPMRRWVWRPLTRSFRGPRSRRSARRPGQQVTQQRRRRGLRRQQRRRRHSFAGTARATRPRFAPGPGNGSTPAWPCPRRRGGRC